MADVQLYYPDELPEDYDRALLQYEFEKVARVLAALEVPSVLLVPQHAVPDRPQEGMIVHADGTDWNPGAGAGTYEYVGGAWSKL